MNGLISLTGTMRPVETVSLTLTPRLRLLMCLLLALLSPQSWPGVEQC